MDRNTNSFHYFPPAGQKPPPTTIPNRGKLVLVLVLSAIFLLACGFGAVVRITHQMFQTLPTLEQLENIAPPLVSKALAKDGSVICEFGIERRFWVPIDSIPPNLVNAVVAIEDRKFYDHWGIDFKRILGAMFVDVLSRENAQGASTITQQLARNVYLTARKSMVRKIREILTAIQIERHYSKREILELYLNQVYLGSGCYGVEAASQTYFSKRAFDLTLNECAAIAGTIQLPEYYRPDKQKNMPRLLARRNAVISGMRKMKYIDKKTARATVKEPIEAHPAEPVSKIAPYFVDMVRQYVLQKYGEDALYNDGLVIHTTLDLVAQDTAEHAAAAHLKFLQRRLNRMCVDSSGIWKTLHIPRDTLLSHFDSLHAVYRKDFVALPDSVKLRYAQVVVAALDVSSGAMLTLIGGRDFDESKFNRAIQSQRQPGSAFKPFVYTTAMEHGFSPMSVVLDQPVTIETPEGDWRPQDFDKEFLGPVTVRRALYKSLNLPAIQVLLQVGADTVIQYARRMGITAELSPVPSLAIGACEVVPLELISAYSIFPNGGMHAQPYYIEEIDDQNGKVLEKHHPASEEVLSAQTAFLMCDMMSDVVRRGTAAAIPGKGFTRPAAGKTGTTNDYSDAWFIGYTPQIVCGVWVGVDERRSLGRGVTGSDGAIPIWVPTALALHRSLPVAYFRKPAGVDAVKVCTESHKIATNACPDPGIDYVIEGMNVDTCDIHGARRHKTDDFFGSSTSRPKSSGNKRGRLLF
jgi:penicillin-binding protein 1A